jgi:hypothetical protein
MLEFRRHEKPKTVGEVLRFRSYSAYSGRSSDYLVEKVADRAESIEELRQAHPRYLGLYHVFERVRFEGRWVPLYMGDVVFEKNGVNIPVQSGKCESVGQLVKNELEKTERRRRERR